MSRSPPMTEDQFRWAEALALERIHGDRVGVFVAERIGALALAGDAAGVERMKAIAGKLEEIDIATICNAPTITEAANRSDATCGKLIYQSAT